MKIFNEIQYDDLPKDLQFIADCCNIETVRLLLENFNGLYFYIPKITKMPKLIKRYYKENNKSLKEIAKELNVSETYLRKVIK